MAKRGSLESTGRVPLKSPKAGKPVALSGRRKDVYSFGAGKAEGDGSRKDLLGGKGANLAEMARLGLPVPPGFTITTEVCSYFYAHKKTYPPGLKEEAEAQLAAVEKALGRKFGDSANPLTVSVRSGGRASMPGMMDTILNLGLNDKTTRRSRAWPRRRRTRASPGTAIGDSWRCTVTSFSASSPRTAASAIRSR
jgi:pyruvate,orthophosphate dikinase